MRKKNTYVSENQSTSTFESPNHQCSFDHHQNASHHHIFYVSFDAQDQYFSMRYHPDFELASSPKNLPIYLNFKFFEFWCENRKSQRNSEVCDIFVVCCNLVCVEYRRRRERRTIHTEKRKLLKCILFYHHHKSSTHTTQHKTSLSCEHHGQFRKSENFRKLENHNQKKFKMKILLSIITISILLIRSSASLNNYKCKNASSDWPSCVSPQSSYNLRFGSGNNFPITAYVYDT